jgi:hypothetical protein
MGLIVGFIISISFIAYSLANTGTLISEFASIASVSCALITIAYAKKSNP